MNAITNAAKAKITAQKWYTKSKAGFLGEQSFDRSLDDWIELAFQVVAQNSPASSESAMAGLVIKVVKYSFDHGETIERAYALC